MLIEEHLDEAAAALAALNGISHELALRYVFLIGDTIERDDDGRAVVRDDQGRELARVKLPPPDEE
jgi:hypothetical protein